MNSRILGLHGNCARLLYNLHFHNKQVVRKLYSPETLKIDVYLKEKSFAKSLFKDQEKDFRQRMINVASSDSELDSHDLRNMLGICDGTGEDLDLLFKLCKKKPLSSVASRISPFKHGPNVMRMLYHFGLPQVAIQVLRDEELKGFFDQASSYQLSMDILFEAGLYNEVLEVSDIIKRRASNLPVSCLLLSLAACYKMNSEEALHTAVELIKLRSNNSRLRVPLRALSFAISLAIKQGNLEVAEDLFSHSESPNHIFTRNLKILLDIRLANYEVILATLKDGVLQNEPEREMDRRSTSTNTTETKYFIFSDVEKELNETFLSHSDPDLVNAYNDLNDILITTGLISPKTIEANLFEPIQFTRKFEGNLRDENFNTLRRQNFDF